MSVSTPNVPNPVQVLRVRERNAEDFHSFANKRTTFPSREEFLGSIQPDSYSEFNYVDVNKAVRQILEHVYQEEPSL
jgi:hypothetical protein